VTAFFKLRPCPFGFFFPAVAAELLFHGAALRAEERAAILAFVDFIYFLAAEFTFGHTRSLLRLFFKLLFGFKLCLTEHA